MCVWTVGFSIGTSVSTRLSRLRGIQSADEMNTAASADGRPWPAPKQTMRACSKKRPTMLLTMMLSEAGNAGAQAADAANHERNRHPRIGGAVEGVDNLPIDE